MRDLPSLKALLVFEAASRLNSMLKAAEELRVSPSAVSHQIRALERELGVSLFHRVHRSIVLTDIGQRYAAEVGEVFGALEAATRNLTRRGKSDILTVHVVPSLATLWLMPKLSRFGALNPEIDVRLNASNEPADLDGGSVDFDIRYGAVPPEAGLAVEPFPKERIVALCAPALLQGAGALSAPADMRHHALIHSETNLYRWGDWAKDHGVPLDLKRGPRFDRSFMAISAAMDGMGVCLESKLLVARELEAGRLVLPFGEEGPSLQCHSLLYRRSRARIPKLAAFRAWLGGVLAAEGMA